MSQISVLCSFLSVLEEAGQLVRVNAIAPGTVLLAETASEAKVQWAERNSLLMRVGTPEDVVKTVLFLTEMDFATGAVCLVDGGGALV